jgi:high affinity sulfate transporter 1
MSFLVGSGNVKGDGMAVVHGRQGPVAGRQISLFGRQFSIMEGVLPIDRARVSTDIVAGVTLAALAIPEVMGYTKIAGMPVITGLYTILIPIALFALLGSSRHLVVGADSATAAIMAAGLAGLAATASPQYVALAGLLALITAAILLIARLIGLGFLADFLSRTVLIGFLTGVGIQVAIGQISGMLGLPGGGSGTLDKLVKDIQQLPQTSGLTLLVSLIVLGLIIGCKRFAPNVPGALIAVIGMIAASYFFNLSAKGVSTLGTVPSGLPTFGLPQGVTWSDIPPLIPIAFSCFLVILAQSAATSRAYAAKYNERFSENSDLVGLTFASVGAGLSGTFVVNGSPTKTQMVDGAGGRSQISQLTTSVLVLIVLLFLTKPLAFMPNAVLAAVVFYIGVELIDIKGMRSILAQRPPEFWVALITAATVVFIGVEQAIFLAMVLSLLEHVRRGYHPKNTVLAPEVVDGAQGWRSLPVFTPAEATPGLLIYRFNHSLYYANTEKFSEEILDLVNGADPPVSWLCVDAAAIDDVDWSGGATIRQSFGQLKERGVRLVFAEVADNVRAELDTYEVTKLVGTDAYYSSVATVLAAFEQQQPATDTAT